MKLDTDKDRIKYFHEMISHIEDTIDTRHKFKNTQDVPILLKIIDVLEKERISYDSKLLSFSEFIREVKKDTKSSSSFFGLFSKESKVKQGDDLNKIFKKLMDPIKNIIVAKKLPARFESDLEEKGQEFIISNKLSVNILNLLINFNLTDKLDTMIFIKKIYPALIKYISTREMNLLNGTRKNKSNSSNRRNNNTRRNNKNKNQDQYPFGEKQV
jgi:hypothetical protein